MADFVLGLLAERLGKKLDEKYGDNGFSSRVKMLNTMFKSFADKNQQNDLLSGYLEDFQHYLEGLEKKLFNEDFSQDDLAHFDRRISTTMDDIRFFVQINTTRDVRTVAAVNAELSATAPVQALQTYDPKRLKIDESMIGVKKTSKVFTGTYGTQLIAVKLKLPSDTFTRHSEENFMREALILQILNGRHIPGVIQFYGVDDATAPTKILLEQGKCSLNEFLAANSGFSLGGRLEILSKCCGIFAALVEQKILHRDIKPENVLIMYDHSVKIMNFGYVRSQESGLSSGVTLRGTHSYVAPELLMSTGTYQYSEATDMYSFAIMMNRVLTNVNPFAQYSQTQLIGLMFKSKGMIRPDLITESAYPGNEGVCQGLAAIITLCWNVYPQLRLTFRHLEEQLKLLAPKAQEIEDVLMEEG